MQPNLEDLTRIDASLIPQASEVLTRAFWNDPFDLYFFPDESSRRKCLPAFFEYRLKQGLRYGEVYATSPSLEGIAVWTDPTRVKSSFWRELFTGGFKLYRMYGGTIIKEMRQFEAFAMERHAKYARPPYMHLGPLGVNPQHQGKGHASRLIKPMLRRLDGEGVSCYLETQNKDNVSLYEHLGFEVVAEGVAPFLDIPHWDMIHMPP